jgi:hypothetical protein
MGKVRREETALCCTWFWSWELLEFLVYVISSASKRSPYTLSLLWVHVMYFGVVAVKREQASAAGVVAVTREQASAAGVGEGTREQASAVGVVAVTHEQASAAG